MASEAVKRILEAEAEADKLNADARRKAEDIVSEAERNSAVAVQKRLAEAKAEAEKIKLANDKRLKEYSAEAEKEYSKRLDELKGRAEKNSDKAVSAVIDSFFS